MKTPEERVAKLLNEEEIEKVEIGRNGVTIKTSDHLIHLTSDKAVYLDVEYRDLYE